MKRLPRTPAGFLKRRDFLKRAAGSAIALGLTRPPFPAAAQTKVPGANGDVRIAMVGLGAQDAVGGVGGRGHQLIGSLQKVPGARIVALCDVDQRVLEHQAAQLKDLGQSPSLHRDLRRVLDDPNVDAVVVATPNHWHALATVWACQAGKDVYVEKPVSHGIWEGRQMVAAARKHRRVVQSGTQARSSSALKQAFDWLRQGELGPIRFARVIVYRPRASIGKVAAPTPIPEEVDYDLWCGPAEKLPLRRRQLHYDWHWSWATGGGEMGNNGVHYIDMCRWALKLDAPAPRVLSLGGRFGFADDGETPNSQVAILDYQPAPIYCEIRALPEKKGSQSADSYLGLKTGLVVQCEGGYFTGAHLSGSAFDPQGKRIKEFGPIPWEDMDTGHLANFVEAVRSRNPAALNAEILEGHLSAACCHQANISQRLGQSTTPDVLAERTKSNSVLTEAIGRYHDHLRANEIDFGRTEVLGPWLTFDPRAERFTGEHAAEANALLRRDYRAPFVVPEVS